MKKRLDILLVEKELVNSRTKAQWLIKNGYILVENKKVLKPNKRIENSLKIDMLKEFPYVGRGGLKLESALKNFSISVKGKVCVDIGASIGGFTDCLIKHGASKVYAIDTAFDLLHPSLINKEEKVVPLFGVDARSPLLLPEKVDLVTVDITFASVKSVIPNVKDYLKKLGDLIILVKPLFETDFYENKKFKIILNNKDLYKILVDLMEWCINKSIFPIGIEFSPLLGKGGSIEFLTHFKIDKNYGFDYGRSIESLLKPKNTINFL